MADNGDRALLRDWHDDDLVFTIFAGAGVSAGEPSRLPSWAVLARETYKEAKRLNLLRDRREREQIRNQIRDGFLPAAFERLRRVLEVTYVNLIAQKLTWTGHPTRLASLVARATRHRLLTTNLDRVLNLATSREAITGISHGQFSDALQRPKQYLFKLHGDIKDADTWVLTQSDYDRVYAKGAPLRSALETIFAGGPTLFVGYSLRDPDIKRIIKDLSSVFRGAAFRHYLLLPAKEPCDEGNLAQMGISVVRFDDTGGVGLGCERFLVRLVPATVAPEAAPPTERSKVVQKRRGDLNTRLNSLYELRNNLESEGKPSDDVRTAIRQLKRDLHEVSFVDVGDEFYGRTVLRKLGFGNYGTVWLVRGPQDPEPRALKIFHPHHATDDERRARFLRGISAMENLNHEGIVKVHGRYEAPLAFLMDYVEGSDFEKAITARPERGGLGLEDADVCSILLDVGAAVEAAHSHDVFHRDLKPANILISFGTNRAFLTDFDISYFEGATTLTVDGRLGGTWGYAAPEQLRATTGDVRSPAVDVFSLAMILAFWVLRRDPEFGEALTGELPAKVRQEAERRWPSRLAASLIEDLVRTGGSPDPTKRALLVHLVDGLRRIRSLLTGHGMLADRDEYLAEIQSRLSGGSVRVQVALASDGAMRLLYSGERTMIGFKSSFARAIGPAISAAKDWCGSRGLRVTRATHDAESFRFEVEFGAAAMSISRAAEIADVGSEVARRFQPH